MAKKLYLIDGMSHAYRAYYAIRGLTDTKGRPTNAIYGFTNMLRKLISEEEPEYLGVAMDLPGPTVRHEMFDQYKATRRPMPEDLGQQIPFILKVCEVLKIPILTFDKYEADDVIGTLTSKAIQEELDVVIVTIDKDMFQLVSERVTILDTRSMQRLGPSEVQEKFGVLPEKVVDVLSLVGDSSDNIPGAPGIGGKGAVQLITEYGSLDSLLKNSEQVKRKAYRESLQNNEAQILQSRDLVRIHRDLEIPLDLSSLRITEPDQTAATELFIELDFASLVEEFLPSGQTIPANYTGIKSREQLPKLREATRDKTVAIAFSTAEEEPDQVTLEGLAISSAERQGYFLETELLSQAQQEIGEILTGASTWVVHDLKAMHPILEGSGWEFNGQLLDTMLMAYLLNPNQKDYGLKRLTAEYLRYKLERSAEEGNLFETQKHQYLAERADLTLQLNSKLKKRLDQLNLTPLLNEIEIPLVDVLASMEQVGVKLDTDQLEQMSSRLQGRIEELTREIFEISGEEFNINSPKQMGYVLFEKLNLPTPKKTRKAGHYATGVEVLENLAESFDIARLILEYRELTKLKSTYLDALPRLVNPRTGRLHTSYNQMVASTGRLSSSNPNLQNIPVKSELGREIRRAFVAEPGFVLLAADYSQIELRVMAHLSKDPVLVDAFQRGEDIHERTAREVFGMNAVMDPTSFRRHAKVINFGIMYGLSAFGLAKSLKIERKEAQQFIDDYFHRYEGVKHWIDSTLETTRETGVVTTLFGRIRQIPEIKSKNWNVRSFGERTAINAPIQGTAADLIKKAMVDIHRELRHRDLQSRLLLQVHDELVFEVRESEVETMEGLVRDLMENATELCVPLSVDMKTGNSWYDAK